jgi:hypothetical protein
MSRKVQFQWPVRLRCKRLRDFSDSLSGHLGEQRRTSRELVDSQASLLSGRPLYLPP